MNFEEIIKSMPVITRSYMIGCFLTTLAVYLDVVNPMALMLNFPRIKTHLELWRLVTNFFFFDYFGLNFLFHMFFLVRHSKLLEEGSYRGRTGDFFYLYLFGSVMLTLVGYILYLAPPYVPKVMFLAPSLAFVIVYVWSRRNPHITLSFLGLFTFSAPYLPWVIIGFGMLLNHSLVSDLLGVVVGHIYYFLEDIYPQTSGRRLLRTPGIIKAMFDIQEATVADRPMGRPWGVGQQVNPVGVARDANLQGEQMNQQHED